MAPTNQSIAESTKDTSHTYIPHRYSQLGNLFIARFVCQFCLSLGSNEQSPLAELLPTLSYVSVFDVSHLIWTAQYYDKLDLS